MGKKKEDIAELIQKENKAKDTKTVKYAKFIFRFVEDPGKTLHFNYEGTNYGYTDSQTYKAPLEIAEHLNTLKRPKWEFKRVGDEDKAEKVMTGEIPRCFAQVLEIYDKEV